VGAANAETADDMSLRVDERNVSFQTCVSMWERREGEAFQGFD
tara:strand:- start:8609 stop:8737 length:129 start_codon:yes stop_codon:yes gene_type:complete